jgi:hypothetical protein
MMIRLQFDYNVLIDGEILRAGYAAPPSIEIGKIYG